MAIGFSPDVGGNMGVGPICVDCGGSAKGIAPTGWTLGRPNGPGVPPSACATIGLMSPAAVQNLAVPCATYQTVSTSKGSCDCS